ncbi:hypothetical protein RFI_29022, partial [Reticulomyxa filosa]
DIETTKQLIVFKEHEHWISSVKYGLNELKNIGCANTILSGSYDNTIRFWDIRSNKNELYVIKGYKGFEILCLTFMQLKKNNENISDVDLCYGSSKGLRVWGKPLSLAITFYIYMILSFSILHTCILFKLVIFDFLLFALSYISKQLCLNFKNG